LPIDPKKLSTAELENLIENHRRQRATEAPVYADALRELEKRKAKGFDWACPGLVDS
jgi:hypothetical protein